MTQADGLSYKDYLKVDRLLSLQKPRSKPAQHDETLFIIIHQTFELWFKEILNELEAVHRSLMKLNVREAIRLMNRVVTIEKLLIDQIHVLETMRPEDFLKFRDVLSTSSAFQSLQFREIEFFSGLKDPRFLLPLNRVAPSDYNRLKKRFEKPSIWDAFTFILMKHGFRVQLSPGEQDMGERERRKRKLEKETKAIVDLFSSEQHPDIRDLSEALLAHDQNFWLWRYHHMAVVERMIGMKIGSGSPHVTDVTGGLSSGVPYLKTTLSKRFYPALWKARTGFPIPTEEE